MIVNILIMRLNMHKNKLPLALYSYTVQTQVRYLACHLTPRKENEQGTVPKKSNHQFTYQYRFKGSNELCMSVMFYSFCHVSFFGYLCLMGECSSWLSATWRRKWEFDGSHSKQPTCTAESEDPQEKDFKQTLAASTGLALKGFY